MREFAIRSLLGAGLALGACYTHAKAEGAATLTLEEAKKAEGHVLASKEFKADPKGQIITFEDLTEMKDAKISVVAGDKTVEGTMNRKEASVTTYVSLGDNKSRRTLESKTGNTKRALNGQEQNMPEKDDALLGVPVLLEYKDGKRVATLESGATAKGEQAKELEKLNKTINKHGDFAMYGDTPRKVGDKWTVDPQDLTAFGETRKLSGSFTVEFAEIKEFHGTPCAVLKAQFDLTGEGNAGDPEDGGKMKVTHKGSVIVHRSLADQQDLESKFTADLTMDTSPQPGVAVHVEGPISMTSKTTVKKP